MDTYTVDVVLLCHEGRWTAQVLQYDIGGEAETVDDALYELQRAFVGYLAACEQATGEFMLQEHHAQESSRGKVRRVCH